MINRLEILKQSLLKKEQLLDSKFEQHFATVKQANGQPLNDKRNGSATLKKWDKQSDGIRALQQSIEITKLAIEAEQGKIMAVEHANNFIPPEIQQLVLSGELTQWRKHPNTFFVVGVEKARIIWDEKKKIVAHKFYREIPTAEQRIKFAEKYNYLNSILNHGK